MPGTSLSGGSLLSEAVGLLPWIAGGAAVQRSCRPLPNPGGVDLDDLRICAGSMRELDNTENPVAEDDY
jgi:hypothetical protein